MSLRIVLADDHQIVLTGLQELISREADLEVVGMAHTGKEAIRLVSETSPDVVVLDVTMPDMNGIEVTRVLKDRDPGLAILGFSMHDNRRMVVEILRAGARGYILKESNPKDLLTAIRTVVQKGLVYLSPKVTHTILEDYLKLLERGAAPPPQRLSPRETEVLRFLVRGSSTREIGQELHISKNTVDTHRRNIMDKLGCNSIAELTRLAIRENLVDPE